MDSSFSSSRLLVPSRTTATIYLLLLALALPPSARAYPGQATDEAFAVLLSLFVAEPTEGRRDVPVSAAFFGSDERDLIHWLSIQQGKGANFNAYRHCGTLLHHAILGGRDDTALWLLQQGADPRLPVKCESENLSALDLALRYQRDRVVRALTAAPYRLSPSPPSGPNAPYAMSPELVLIRNFGPPADATVLGIRALLAAMHTDLFPFGHRSVGSEAMERSMRQARPILDQLPPERLQQALDDDDALRHWLDWLSVQAPADFSHYLQAVSPGLLQARLPATLQGMVQDVHITHDREVGEQKRAEARTLAENWRTLLARLPGSLQGRDIPSLLHRAPTEVWPLLLARGYRIGDPGQELGDWLERAPTASLEVLWPVLLPHAPALRQQGIRLALGLRQANAVFYEGGLSAETLEKVRFLLAQGAEPPRLTLGAECERRCNAEWVRELAALHVLVPLPPSVGPRFVAVPPPSCAFTLNDAWYQALRNHPVINEDRGGIFVNEVAVIPVPGGEECVLLLQGDQWADDNASYIHETLDGVFRDPFPSCPDPFDAMETWRQARDGGLQKMPVMGVSPRWKGSDYLPARVLGLLQDTSDGRYYWLAYFQGGGCFQEYSYLLHWQPGPEGMVLTALETMDPTWQAFARQCDPHVVDDCPALKSFFSWMRDDAGQEAPIFARTPESFIDTYRQMERAVWLTAVMALDRATLKSLGTADIPYWWWREALSQVSVSSLPLAEKRKRIAWLFHEHAQLKAALSSDILESLLDWLPREDWWPVFKTLPVGYDESLKRLSQKAQESGRKELGCAIDHHMGLICGATLSPY